MGVKLMAEHPLWKGAAGLNQKLGNQGSCNGQALRTGTQAGSSEAHSVGGSDNIGQHPQSPVTVPECDTEPVVHRVKGGAAGLHWPRRTETGHDLRPEVEESTLVTRT